MRLFSEKLRAARILLLLIALAAFIFWQHENIFPAKPWPKNKTITFYNASDYERSLDEAISQWDETGIPIRFEEVLDKKEADLVIEDSTKTLKEDCNKPKTCVGWASYIGYPDAYPFGPDQTRIVLMEANANEEKTMIDPYNTTIIIHELGHVLGLEHGDKDCSVMAEKQISCSSNSDIISKEVNGRLEFYYDCGPWEKDIVSLEKLYKVDLSVPGRCHDYGNDVIVKPLGSTVPIPIDAQAKAYYQNQIGK